MEKSCAELNQPDGRVPCLSAWKTVQDDSGLWFVVRNDREEERYQAPDGHNRVEGVPMPPFIRQNTWCKLREVFEPHDGDVWVATFPKCGTTYMEQIVLLLRNNCDTSQTDLSNKNTFTKESGTGKIWPERSVRVELDPKDKGSQFEFSIVDLPTFDAVPGPRLLKTHAPRQLFLGTSSAGLSAPIAGGTKVIYVCRNAKDACVSAYYHAANPHKLGFPFDAWAKTWISGLFESGSWAEHTANWHAEHMTNPSQVLWVRFEDLVENSRAEIVRIAKFIGVPASDELVDRVVEASSFSCMKACSGNAAFFRKGETGDYKNHFSTELMAEWDTELKLQKQELESKIEGWVGWKDVVRDT